MKFNRRYKIDAVAADGQRPGINVVQLEKYDATSDGGLLVATDGSILVALKVIETADDDAGPLSPEVFDHARRATTRKQPEANIEAKATAVITGARLPGFVNVDRKSDVAFPDWRAVLPQPKRDYIKVGISVDLLRRLAAGMGDNQVELSIPLPDDMTKCVTDPIMVAPLDGDARSVVKHAVIMPVRVE